MLARTLLVAALSLAVAGDPSTPDLRPAMNAFSLTPRDQGARGTCSAFAVTEAIEWALAKHESKGTRLSVEFLNWASNDAVGVRADGGFFSDLWKGFERHGIADESAWPYAAQFDPNAAPAADAVRQAKERLTRTDGARWSLHWIKAWDVTTGLQDTEMTAIVETLGKGFPVCAGMRWPKATRFERERLGWAEAADVFDGHSVLLVGLRADTTVPNERVFLVRNSSLAHPDIEITERFLRAYVNDAMWIELAPTALPSPAAEGSKP